MPLSEANDPMRTTEWNAADGPSRPDVTADYSEVSPAENGDTVAYVSDPERIRAAVLVPGYDIEGVLGRGGMGVVYKARHQKLKRTVALKMVLAGGHAGPQILARFRIEAEAVARLQHPNIVQIHEVGEADGHPYCALEFIDGGTLAGKLQGGPMPVREAAQLVEVLASAMQLAHSRHVVHRDLKPANILLAADGMPKISDFGLARQLDEDSGETRDGAVLGTPSYMAPEQAFGQAHDAGPAADVYALGAILYDCLAGRPPFKGKTVVETLDHVRTRLPDPPSRWQAHIPPELEAVCLKCLEKDPSKRYSSAQELADDLARWGHGEPTRVRPWSWRRRLAGRIRKRWKPISATAFVLATAAAFWVTFVLSSPEYRARQAMRRIDEAVRSGSRVELVGGVGPPKWSRPVFDAVDSKSSTDPSGIFQVSANAAALIELAPAAHHDRYRLSAEVRLISSKPGVAGSAGLYFAHHSGPADPAGYAERLLVVQYDRNFSLFDQSHDTVNLYDLILFSRNGATRLEKPKPLGSHRYAIDRNASDEPWRHFEVEVTPESIRANWRDRDGRLQVVGVRNDVLNTVNPVPTDVVRDLTPPRARYAVEQNPNIPHRLEYHPRGAFGLYVANGVAEFRHVAYETALKDPTP